ncbi:MAG: hypothetical protein Q9192_006170, partial [Flavoplaca navasiana]
EQENDKITKANTEKNKGSAEPVADFIRKQRAAGNGANTAGGGQGSNEAAGNNPGGQSGNAGNGQRRRGCNIM